MLEWPSSNEDQVFSSAKVLGHSSDYFPKDSFLVQEERSEVGHSFEDLEE